MGVTSLPFRVALPLALGAMVAGCATSRTIPVSGGATVAAPPRARGVTTRPPLRRNPPLPQVQTLAGADGVIGAAPAELIRQFGAPRLDVWEGDARKLQYSGTACVLDIYLYPQAPGREPKATYVDARRVSDGQEVDRAACVAALRRKPAVPAR
ncbi:MAG: hypothetical protein V4579_11180 [Pseudomonadota bacterium]